MSSRSFRSLPPYPVLGSACCTVVGGSGGQSRCRFGSGRGSGVVIGSIVSEDFEKVALLSIFDFYTAAKDKISFQKSSKKVIFSKPGFLNTERTLRRGGRCRRATCRCLLAHMTCQTLPTFLGRKKLQRFSDNDIGDATLDHVPSTVILSERHCISACVIRADGKSQVRLCFGFCTAAFLSSLAYESD